MENVIPDNAPARNYKDADGARWYAPQIDERSWYVERIDEYDATLYRFGTWAEAEEFWSGVGADVEVEI